MKHTKSSKVSIHVEPEKNIEPWMSEPPRRLKVEQLNFERYRITCEEYPTINPDSYLSK